MACCLYELRISHVLEMCCCAVGCLLLHPGHSLLPRHVPLSYMLLSKHVLLWYVQWVGWKTCVTGACLHDDNRNCVCRYTFINRCFLLSSAVYAACMYVVVIVECKCSSVLLHVCTHACWHNCYVDEYILYQLRCQFCWWRLTHAAKTSCLLSFCWTTLLEKLPNLMPAL